ncbi:pleckstrin homology domain-containing family S member 1-like [Hoplias malabaricus]|uniref:pleckstrin homology domain-containing family S member 1-like n=1 Tax=Hoplias malabaricus TaxID=27720 RepID=UPI0034629415
MSSNLQKFSVGGNSLFYKMEAPDTEVVQFGFLYKSPPHSLLTKSMKSWKRRYFVLSRIGGHSYELKYFKDNMKRDKPAGEIDLYQISLLFLDPETHRTWEWIQKNFRCSSSCVLYMRVLDRDYFLIGENSTEMEGWFNAIFAALKTRTNKALCPEENRKNRSISEPSEVKTSYDDQDLGKNKALELLKKLSPPLVRRSAPEFNVQYDHYDYPRAYKMKTLPKSEDEDEDDEEDEMKEKSETDKDTDYMDMSIVKKAVSEVPIEDPYLIIQPTQTRRASLSYSEDFCNGTADESQDAKLPCTSKTLFPEEKEICVNQEELKNMVFSEEAGKPCVSDWKHVETSSQLHVGDQIVAINDLFTENLDELQTYIKRLSKNWVRLTILRQPGSRPLSGCSA